MSDEEWVILFMLCGKAGDWIANNKTETGLLMDGFPKEVLAIADRLELKEELMSFVSYYDNGF